MKRNGKATLLGTLVLASASCTDLTETVYNAVTDENFDPSEEDIGSIIAPAYQVLQGVWPSWYGALDGLEETADVLLTPARPNGWFDGGIYIRGHQHRWDANFGQHEAIWNDAFNGITATNRIIHQIESGVVPISDEQLKADLVAEMRAVRAYDYYLLLDVFGNVPIVTDFTSTELPSQSPRSEVYDFVVSELTAVLPELSQDPAETYGRMNHWVARALLSRIYLNAEVYTGTPQWEAVLDQTQAIIESGHYALDPDYRMPFSRTNGAVSSELIFAIPYDAVYATGSNFHMKTLKGQLREVFGLQATPWGGSAANPQAIDTYAESDTRLEDTWLMGAHFTPDGEFGYDFTKHVNSIEASLCYCAGFPVWKYEIYSGMTGSSDVDFPVIRYAEILMNRAEALLRTGGANDAALLVTQVRQRAFADTDPAAATVTGAELMEGSSYLYGWYDTDGVVKTGPGGSPVTNDTGGAYGGADIEYGRFLDELLWEFAVEGHRRQQLIRFGVYESKAWFNKEARNEPYRLLFAIPQDVLNANANLQQNPGY
jgi:hypothetical protein